MWACGPEWVALFCVLPFLEVAYEKHSNSPPHCILPMPWRSLAQAALEYGHGTNCLCMFRYKTVLSKGSPGCWMRNGRCTYINSHTTAPLGMPLPHVQQMSENAVLRHVDCFGAMMPGTGIPIQPVSERVRVITYTVT